MSNDIAVVLILLFGKTIRGLGCSLEFQVGASRVVKMLHSLLKRNIFKRKGLVIGLCTGVFARVHTIKESNTDHVGNRFFPHRR